MIEPKWLDIRCAKCGTKLGEHMLRSGSIRILCLRNHGKGSGACRTMNTITVNEKNLQNAKNAI